MDEWVNDDDTGYSIITLSEEEFYDYEEVGPSLSTHEPLSHILIFL